jgi:hypothetical protein
VRNILRSLDGIGFVEFGHETSCATSCSGSSSVQAAYRGDHLRAQPLMLEVGSRTGRNRGRRGRRGHSGARRACGASGRRTPVRR